ncbi:nuclear envelope integral membrane protein [Drosophila tropicalis]|uniref:nuclear envelope integral membrane protein n=1 Tax=Drosophila tropicalis TaxID=46794 RepID=UPI0035ABCADD
MVIFIIIFLILPGFISTLPHKSMAQKLLVTYLQDGETYIQNDLPVLRILYDTNIIKIYCRQASPLTWQNLFQTVELHLEFQETKNVVDWQQYREKTAFEVYRAHHLKREYFVGKYLTKSKQKTHVIELPAHEKSCYGIYTNRTYKLKVGKMPCDRDRLAQLILGFGLFLMAPMISTSPYCFTFSSICFGWWVSSVILVQVALYLAGDRDFKGLQPLITNLNIIFEENMMLVIGIWVAAGLLMKKLCLRWRWLWQFSIIRHVLCRIYRLVAYLMISSASDYNLFGWFCVFVFMPWRELACLYVWLKKHNIYYRRLIGQFLGYKKNQPIKNEEPFANRIQEIGNQQEMNLLIAHDLYQSKYQMHLRVMNQDPPELMGIDFVNDDDGYSSSITTIHSNRYQFKSGSSSSRSLRYGD